MIHSMRRAKPEWMSATWKPRLVKTPVPIILAMTIPEAVRKPMEGALGFSTRRILTDSVEGALFFLAPDARAPLREAPGRSEPMAACQIANFSVDVSKFFGDALRVAS